MEDFAVNRPPDSANLNSFFNELSNSVKNFIKQLQYSLRNQDVIGRIKARTEKFKSSFYPHCLSEWNDLDPEIRLAPSAAVLKRKLLSIIRPPVRSISSLHDAQGHSYLTQLRVVLEN